ncbi:helix-turn-helix domain-containing protein [Kitasatospora sp. NPDC092948]|uniref:helix-turn-helix domain-containing protein n=1 Tax=Kitasatospora sp. NPDC092948 TaxID=3364088 RepID=UPI0037FBA149
MTTATELPLGRRTGTVPVLYRVEDVVEALSLSRTVIYDLIRVGRLRTVKEGRSRLVPASAINEYVALLENEARG